MSIQCQARRVCKMAAFVFLYASTSTSCAVAQQSNQGVYELIPIERRFQDSPFEFRFVAGDAELPQTEQVSVPPKSSQTRSQLRSPARGEPVNDSKAGHDRSGLGSTNYDTPSGRRSAPRAIDSDIRIQPRENSAPREDSSVRPATTEISPATPPALIQVAGESDTAPTKPPESSTTISGNDAPARLSVATVDERRKQVEAGELADEVKKATLAHYQQALEVLRRADEVQRKADELRAEKEKGPQLFAEIRSQLAQSPESPEPQPPADASVSELEQLRLADEERLSDTRKALESWEQRAKLRAERKPQMPALIDKTKQQLADARKSMEAPAPDGEAPAVAQARRTEQEAFVLLLQTQLDLYQVEKARYDALTELFPLQRDLLVRNRNLLEKRSAAWKAVLVAAGRRETERQAAEARRKLHNAHPALRELAERNAELIQLRTRLQELLVGTRGKLDGISQLLDRVESDFTSVKDTEKRAGLTTAVGILLRNQRNHLPPNAPYREHRRYAESQMTRLQLEQMPLEAERADLGDTVTRAEEIAGEVSHRQMHAGDPIREMTLSLLNDRKKYLDDVLGDFDACIRELAELDVRSRKLIETTSEYRNYIDERVLWIRSAAIVGFETPRRALAGLVDIARPEQWYLLGQALWGDAWRTPLLTSLLVCGLVIVLVLRSRLQRWVNALGEETGQRTVAGVLTTVSALLLTLAIASVWPIVLWLVGRRLSIGLDEEFAVAVGESLKTAAIVYWSVEVFRQICRPGGIAAQHLKWPEQSMRSLHRKLLTLMSIGLPLVFGVCLAERWQDGMWADSFGRILFVTGMVWLASSIKQILRPEGRVLGEALSRHWEGWLYRARRLWYPVAIAVPLLLAGMAVAGYQFTAQQLLIRFELTCWLLIVLLIAFTLTMRWLMTARIKLAREQARVSRLAAEAESPQPGDELGPAPKVEAPKVDFSTLNDQMLKLVRAAACMLFVTGVWFIWGEVLPALQMLNRVDLWHTTVQVAEDVELAEGQTETRLVTKPRAITLGSLLLAAGLLIVATVAGRNIPGLLELSILQRLPMDHGGRNAITTLCRYALTLSGVVLAARTIGIGWSSVQWLIAALTVGLGFGLQEIFANFVSGLIILFERPVRIGDVVTIDGVSGSVSRIQIRATTITDFDRKEYILPNKDFVTGRVLNWTLSDKTNRIVITVGVAYGSNTELARSLLVKVATEHPVVLDDPAPMATFEGFGDSCLTLLLRCFLPSLENRLKTITELHEAIDLEFKAHGLEIAFPQRDIHVRSMVAMQASAPVPAPARAEQPKEQRAA